MVKCLEENLEERRGIERLGQLDILWFKNDQTNYLNPEQIKEDVGE